MFRSMSNFKGMTFDEEEEDPGSCISNAAMGFHNEELSPFLTTSIPHDRKEKIEFRISPYGSMDNLVENKGNRESQSSKNKTLTKSPQKKNEPEPIPSKFTANNKEIRMKRQELGVPMSYGLRKSPVSRRRINRGISLDSYHNGEYFRDNYGNIYVHTLLPRATTFDTPSELSSVVDPKVVNFLKSSIKKWKQNIKARNRQQNDGPKNEISSAVEKECSNYTELPSAAFDNELINYTETRPNKRQHNSKLERTKKITESDLDTILDINCYRGNYLDKDATEKNKKQNIKTKNSKWKQDRESGKSKSIVEIPETVPCKYESSFQTNSIGKSCDFSIENDPLNSVRINQGKVHIPLNDFTRIRKLQKERDSETKMQQNRLSPDCRKRGNTKNDSLQPRIQCFTNQSVRYFTVIEDDKKKYVSSLNFDLK